MVIALDENYAHNAAAAAEKSTICVTQDENDFFSSSTLGVVIG
jgi:hypothetical protein